MRLRQDESSGCSKFWELLSGIVYLRLLVQVYHLCNHLAEMGQGTIDHLVMGRVESWDTLPYLPQYLCYLTENIYQCGSLHERTIYQVRIFFL